ncbi:MAG: PEP-CTERM sorting domain-containing protein [Phycisphaerae bacterium]|jgi:hypothetical protein
MFTKRERRSFVGILLVVFALNVSVYANMIYNFDIFNNSQYENDPRFNFTITLTDEGLSSTGKHLVGFRFDNDSTADSSITDIYFDAYPDTSSCLDFSNVSVIESSGVSFSKKANPKTLPGGSELTPKFDKTPEYSADSDSPVSPKGINPGEWLSLVFTLKNNKSYDDVIAQIANGGSTCQENLRIGIHIQSLPAGCRCSCDDSASAINCTQPIPEPATMAMLSIGAVFMLRNFSNKKTVI